MTDNLFGDILTDIGAAIGGGIGLAASGNIDATRTNPSMFEPVHGSAPDIAGQGKADPTATVLSVALLLEHLGHADEARRVEQAVADDLASRGRGAALDRRGRARRCSPASDRALPPPAASPPRDAPRGSEAAPASGMIDAGRAVRRERGPAKGRIAVRTRAEKAAIMPLKRSAGSWSACPDVIMPVSRVLLAGRDRGAWWVGQRCTTGRGTASPAERTGRPRAGSTYDAPRDVGGVRRRARPPCDAPRIWR